MIQHIIAATKRKSLSIMRPRQQSVPICSERSSSSASIGLSEESEKKISPLSKRQNRLRRNNVSFIDQVDNSPIKIDFEVTRKRRQSNLTRQNLGIMHDQRVRDKTLKKNLKKWSNIIMMPDDDIESGEVIRPFVIVQPQMQLKDKNKMHSKKKGQNFNPRCDPPNSLEFFKEWNMNALEKYPGKLPSSRALTSKMQQRGAMYLNIKDDMDYKSLYGEKNPGLDSTVTQDKEFYMQMLQ